MTPPISNLNLSKELKNHDQQEIAQENIVKNSPNSFLAQYRVTTYREDINLQIKSHFDNMSEGMKELNNDLISYTQQVDNLIKLIKNKPKTIEAQNNSIDNDKIDGGDALVKVTDKIESKLYLSSNYQEPKQETISQNQCDLKDDSALSKVTDYNMLRSDNISPHDNIESACQDKDNLSQEDYRNNFNNLPTSHLSGIQEIDRKNPDIYYMLRDIEFYLYCRDPENHYVYKVRQGNINAYNYITYFINNVFKYATQEEVNKIVHQISGVRQEFNKKQFTLDELLENRYNNVVDIIKVLFDMELISTEFLVHMHKRVRSCSILKP